MGGFIISSTVALVLLQSTLLLLDREQTSWTFTLMQKTNAPDMYTLDMQACLRLHSPNSSSGNSSDSTHYNSAPQATETHCFLWFHTSQQIEPVLAQWNPHLILLAIACIHCIISLYAVPKLKATKKSDTQNTSSAYGLYVSGLQSFLLFGGFSSNNNVSVGLFVLWVIIACVVGFAQHSSHHHYSTLDTSTWVSCLFLFAATALFIYMHQVLYSFPLFSMSDMYLTFCFCKTKK